MSDAEDFEVYWTFEEQLEDETIFRCTGWKGATFFFVDETF